MCSRSATTMTRMMTTTTGAMTLRVLPRMAKAPPAMTMRHAAAVEAVVVVVDAAARTRCRPPKANSPPQLHRSRSHRDPPRQPARAASVTYAVPIRVVVEAGVVPEVAGTTVGAALRVEVAVGETSVNRASRVRRAPRGSRSRSMKRCGFRTRRTTFP